MPSGNKEKSLKNKYSSFFSRDIPEPEPESESSMERIYPFLSESFKDSLEETAPILRNMDANTLQQVRDERNRADQQTKELEGSLVLALQAIKRLEVEMQASKTCKPRDQPRKAPIVLMEDNLKTPKELSLTAAVVHAMETKSSGEQDAEKLAKLREVLIKKTRVYSDSFPKYNGESKKEQECCAEICYHAGKYRVDTIAPEDMKFAIFGAVEGKMRNRILHLKPGTLGYNSYTAAEYLEEMLGRFMKA